MSYISTVIHAPVIVAMPHHWIRLRSEEKGQTASSSNSKTPCYTEVFRRASLNVQQLNVQQQKHGAALLS